MEQPLQVTDGLSGSERKVTKMALPGWEPRILVFACHYCAFAAADLAGIMRLSYSPNVRIIRLPCSGKIDHIYVLRAFERGVDGVFVAG